VVQKRSKQKLKQTRDPHEMINYRVILKDILVYHFLKKIMLWIFVCFYIAGNILLINEKFLTYHHNVITTFRSCLF
jgi:hypothetical protein